MESNDYSLIKKKSCVRGNENHKSIQGYGNTCIFLQRYRNTIRHAKSVLIVENLVCNLFKSYFISLFNVRFVYQNECFLFDSFEFIIIFVFCFIDFFSVSSFRQIIYHSFSFISSSSPIKLSVSQYNMPHRFGKTGRSFEAMRLTFTHAHTPQAKASANFIDLCSPYFVVIIIL